MRATDRVLRPLLERQDGMVLSRQLRALGVDRELPGRRGWTSLAPGLWVAGADRVTDGQLLRAAALYGGADAVLSGAAACHVLGMRDVPAVDGGDVLVPGGTRLRGGPLLRVHQTVRTVEQVSGAGLRLASPARAVADAVRWAADLRTGRALVLAAVADGRVRVDDLRTDLAAGQSRGSACLRRCVEDAARGARSAPEAEAADAVTAVWPRRWPRPLLNPVVRCHGDLLGVPDGYVVDAALGWEVDSRRHHGSSAALDATLQRHARFADAGIELLHVTPHRLRRSPQEWARQVLERARRRRGMPSPAGVTVDLADVPA